MLRDFFSKIFERTLINDINEQVGGGFVHSSPFILGNAIVCQSDENENVKFVGKTLSTMKGSENFAAAGLLVTSQLPGEPEHFSIHIRDAHVYKVTLKESLNHCYNPNLMHLKSVRNLLYASSSFKGNGM